MLVPRYGIWPRWLKVTALALALGLLAAVLSYTLRDDTDAEAVAPPPPPVVEYRNWNVYIPTTPQACYDAMEAADAVFVASLASDTATLKAVRLAADGKYSQVPAAIDAAEKAGETLHKKREAYLKDAKKCRV
jgi:hypothetical protein